MREHRRVVVVQTHPVQYLSPWYRWMATHQPSMDLTVLYAAEPGPSAQAAGFGGSFRWDAPLREGYANAVLSPVPFTGALGAESYSAIDAPALESALRGLSPDAVLVPGWHTAFYRRALGVCRRNGWPALYRGDSTLASGRPGVPRFLRWLATRARLRQFSAFLAVGRASREHLLAHGAIDPLIFDSPHAVDNARFEEAAAARRAPGPRAELARRFGLDPARPVVLFAGKLQAVKRPLDVIRAAAMAGARPQVLVAGSGQLEAACRAEAARAGVDAVFAGFLQPDALADAYAVADVLVLPSARETWGMVVNEALASGVPVVVSEAVGCRPDLVDDDTGAAFPVGDAAALARSLDTVLARLAGGYAYAGACRRRARTHSFEAATRGLVRALERLEHRSAHRAADAGGGRLVACCGSMSTPGGLERMTFEVLRAARRQGADVHCIVNTWGSHPIVDMADDIGASWSTGFYWYPLERRLWRPRVALRVAWDVMRTSAGLWRDARRFGATTVLVPDFTVALRNLPALALLRMGGVRVVFRLGSAPEAGSLYRHLWRRVLAPLADVMVCNSRYTARMLAAHGVPEARMTVVPNVLPERRTLVAARPAVPGRILYVGQIIPPKGVHVLLEATATLVARGLDVHLDVAGEIDGWESPSWAGYHDRLRSRAAAPDLRGRVRFLGWRDDVPQLMRDAWIHVVPSLPEQREGFGVVVLEAKAAGTPSVVSASGALPEHVTHGVDGWVADPVTPDTLAEGIAALLGPDRRAHASSAAQASLEAYAPEAFERGWAVAFAWPARPDPPLEARPCL